METNKRDASGTTALFIPCVVDQFFPDIGESMVKVFHEQRIPMAYPSEQTCCGQLAFNNGYWERARLLAKRFIKVFEKSEAIVAPSGSCVEMVRNNYPLLFESEPDWLQRARAVSTKTYEFSEYLVDVLGVVDVGACYEGQVTFHDACHCYGGLGIYIQPRVLLNHVKRVDFVEMQDSTKCCGFGGTFWNKLPHISNAMVDDKVNNIVESRAGAVITSEPACLMNIKGRISRRGLDIQVLHLAQILANR